MYKSWNGFRLFYTIVRLFFAAFVKIRFFNENWCNEHTDKGTDKRFEGQRIIKDKSLFKVLNIQFPCKICYKKFTLRELNLNLT